MASSASASPPAPFLHASPSAPHQLMLVGDTQFHSYMINIGALSLEEYTVHCFSNSERALVALGAKKVNFDLMLNGLPNDNLFLEKVAELDGNLPVIVILPQVSEVIIREALDKGARLCLPLGAINLELFKHIWQFSRARPHPPIPSVLPETISKKKMRVGNYNWYNEAHDVFVRAYSEDPTPSSVIHRMKSYDPSIKPSVVRTHIRVYETQMWEQREREKRGEQREREKRGEQRERGEQLERGLDLNASPDSE